MKNITRLYDRLDNDERARLFFEAAARRDVEELDRLNDTCPQKTYRGEDWNYTRKKHRIHKATLMYQIGNDRAIIAALAALVGFLSYKNEDDIEGCAELVNKAIGIYKGRLLAWQKLCNQMGIADETLTKAAGLEECFAPDFLLGLELDIDPSPEAEKNCLEMLNTLVV